jgi:glutamyl-tRNA synthetase
MTDLVKVRFAPSPTGFLHIGGVRTALFNWLFARHHGGKFVLRIEDTDVSRSTEQSIEEILESLTWLGLDWDEGPYRQMDRQETYNQKVETLLADGKAYRCYCSKEELDAQRKDAEKKGLKPKYDGRCRNRSDAPEGAPSVVRFKVAPEGTVSVHDLLRGQVHFDKKELDDMVLQRTDGTPTYNFVVVVDDADMGISHVIRGDDHLSNTPKQALLYDALNFPRPKFAHISMILGADKSRLSKRHGATSALAYRQQGFLPDALINYLVRLGWSHGDQEMFSRKEMIELFSLENITTSAAVFNLEKLTWLNQQYIKAADPLELAKALEPILVQEQVLPASHNKSLGEIARMVPFLNERSETLAEMAHKSIFYFKEDIEFDKKSRDKFLIPEAQPLLEELQRGLQKLEPFTQENIESVFKSVVEQAGLKLGKLAQPVRVALTGKKESPGIYDVVVLLGKERSCQRLKQASEMIAAL